MKLYYKIVGVNSSCPEKPIVYYGEIEPVSGEHPILTALVDQFGKKGEPALQSLAGWSGGEVEHWSTDLDEYPEAREWEFYCVNNTFYVYLDEQAFPSTNPTIE